MVKKNYGERVLLNYGSGSVKRNVIFPAGYLDLTPEDIKEILKESL